jgi:hypothetical protein
MPTLIAQHSCQHPPLEHSRLVQQVRPLPRSPQRIRRKRTKSVSQLCNGLPDAATGRVGQPPPSPDDCAQDSRGRVWGRRNLPFCQHLSPLRQGARVLFKGCAPLAAFARHILQGILSQLRASHCPLSLMTMSWGSRCPYSVFTLQSNKIQPASSAHASLTHTYVTRLSNADAMRPRSVARAKKRRKSTT